MDNIKYTIDEIREASHCFDNDLVRKTSMKMGDILDLLGDDNNRQEAFHEGIQIIKSKINKDFSFDDLPKVIDGWKYAISNIFNDYNILIHDNLKVVPYTSNLEFYFLLR